MVQDAADRIFAPPTSVGTDHTKLMSYLDALAHKMPNMKIFEIGARASGATFSIMEILTHRGENELGAVRFDKYDITDILSSVSK